MNSNLTDGARFALFDRILLNCNLSLTAGVRRLLTVEVELVASIRCSRRGSTSSSVVEFACLLGIVNEFRGFLQSVRGLAIRIEGTSVDVEVNPITSFEDRELSQCSFASGAKSARCMKR